MLSVCQFERLPGSQPKFKPCPIQPPGGADFYPFNRPVQLSACAHSHPNLHSHTFASHSGANAHPNPNTFKMPEARREDCDRSARSR